MSQQGEDGDSGHFMDDTLKGINNWLPYFQSPGPYAIFEKTVYTMMLKYLQNHPELHPTKAAVTLILSVVFLIQFCFFFFSFVCCSVKLWMELV